MTCHEHRDLIPLYALGALEDGQRDAIEEHLQSGCPDCLAALAEARAVVAKLPLALEPIEPPPAARQELLQRIAVPEARTAGRIGPWVSAAAAAVAGMISAYAVFSFQLQRQRGDHDAQLQRQQEEYGSLQSRLAALENELARDRPATLTERGEGLLQFFRSAALHVIALRDTGEEMTAGRLFWDQDTNRLCVYASQLGPAEQGFGYNLWVHTEADAEPVAIGPLAADAAYRGLFLIELPEEIRSIARAVISHDPVEGDLLTPAREILTGRLH